jgi:hypothetical protein
MLEEATMLRKSKPMVFAASLIWVISGIDVDEAWLWRHYCRDAYAGVVMSVVASQIVETTDRSESLFVAMATRHPPHARDLGAETLL